MLKSGPRPAGAESKGTLRVHVAMGAEARRHLAEKGWLAGHPSRTSYEDFEYAYSWMRDRMVERIGPPDQGPAWPMWGWRRYRGRSKPPASSQRLDEDRWIVSFDIPERRVVLSDFTLWHHVLNGWYLGESDEDEDDEDPWDEMAASGIPMHVHPYPAPWRSRYEASWTRIFDVGCSRSVQATFWRVERSMVVSETFVPARRAKPGSRSG